MGNGLTRKILVVRQRLTGLLSRDLLDWSTSQVATGMGTAVEG